MLNEKNGNTGKDIKNSKNGIFSPSIVPWWGLLLGGTLAYIVAVLVEGKTGFDALASIPAFVGLIFGAVAGLGIGFLVTKIDALRTLIPIAAILAVVVAIGLMFTIGADEDDKDDGGNSANKITIYATTIGSGARQFVVDLSLPLSPVSCDEWENAVKTHTVMSPSRVLIKAIPSTPRTGKC
jgi:hypothetical protein